MDILRVIAIFIIVICHLHYAVPQLETNSAIMMIEIGIGNCGLALFIFLSGYSLMIKKPEFDHVNDAKPYLRKRFSRLFPIYWVALMTLFIIQTFQLLNFESWGAQLAGNNALQTLVYLSGLQILFDNVLYSPPSIVYWFVSAIMIYYLLFPVLLFSANRMGGAFTRSLVLVALLIFLFLLGIQTIYPVIDSRLFAFYWFFIAGIALGRSSSLANIKTRTLASVTILSALGSVPLFLLDGRIGAASESMSEALSGVSIILYGTAAIALAIYLSYKLKKYVVGRYFDLTERIALSTYAIYLFHYYFLLLAASLAVQFAPGFIPLLVLLLGVPLALFIPPYIQDIVDYAISIPSRRLRTQRS